MSIEEDKPSIDFDFNRDLSIPQSALNSITERNNIVLLRFLSRTIGRIPDKRVMKVTSSTSLKCFSHKWTHRATETEVLEINCYLKGNDIVVDDSFQQIERNLNLDFKTFSIYRRYTKQAIRLLQAFMITQFRHIEGEIHIKKDSDNGTFTVVYTPLAAMAQVELVARITSKPYPWYRDFIRSLF